MDMPAFLGATGDIIIALGALFMALYTFSEKFRKWIDGKLKDSDSIKNLNTKHKELEKKEQSLENNCELRSKKIDEICENLNNVIDKMDTKCDNLTKVIDKLDDKVEKDNKSTLLTLKSQIIDICSRVSRYGGITQADKQLLCELYHEYVDVWKENHYVKSEAKKVIEYASVIDDYKEVK